MNPKGPTKHTQSKWISKNCKFAAEENSDYMDFGHSHEDTMRASISLIRTKLLEAERSLGDLDHPSVPMWMFEEVLKLAQEGKAAAERWGQDQWGQRDPDSGDHGDLHPDAAKEDLGGTYVDLDDQS